MYQTLIEHWDGASWTISPSPNTAADQANFLRDVQCTSATDCWAVGYSSLNAVPNASTVTLIERWNGTSWTIVSSPNNPGTNNSLFGLTCVSELRCWAVGSYQAGAETQTLIEQWNGSSWSVVSSPNADPTKSNILSEVACSSASNCWAVGYYTDNLTSQTLIERWDGTSWTITPSANLGTFNNLRAVACASDSECWAVGALYNGSVNYTLIERWDGSSWTIISSPNIDATSNSLYSVVCPSSVGCWAVGEYTGQDFRGAFIGYPLMEHYTLPVVQLNAVVSRKTHGSAGSFDINLPLTGNPGIECRSGGINGDHSIVFTFANTLTSIGGASVTSGTGSVGSSHIDSNDAHNYIVNLTGVTNAQIITVSLTNVSDSLGNSSPTVAGSMGVLLSDVTANGSVSNTDVAAVKAAVAAPVTASNFRNDVNGNGIISNTDVSATKAQVGSSLP